jgi:hypothetical protein
MAPHHEILRKMVSRFERSLPVGVENVLVRMAAAEREILTNPESFDDALATEERSEARANERIFARMWTDARKAFDPATVTGEAMPASVSELLALLQRGTAFWNMASDLYNRTSSQPGDRAIVEKFFRECAPFRAATIAIVAAQFDRCVPAKSGPSLRSGRNDTFMANCLPFCDEFVTHDGGQLACYREVARIAELPTVVRSYDELVSGFYVIGGGSGRSA